MPAMSIATRDPQPPCQPPFPVWRFSVADYHQLIAAGILGENDRVELLEGWIVPKMTHNPLHDGMIQIIRRELSRHLADGWDIRIQSAITTGDSEPEPDLVVARGDERAYLVRHPGPADIGMLIEVSESSLQQDRNDKARIYARAGIGTYGIVNLFDRQIEVHTKPSGPVPAASSGDRTISRGNELVPVVLDGLEVARVAANTFLP